MSFYGWGAASSSGRFAGVTAQASTSAASRCVLMCCLYPLSRLLLLLRPCRISASSIDTRLSSATPCRIRTSPSGVDSKYRGGRTGGPSTPPEKREEVGGGPGLHDDEAGYGPRGKGFIAHVDVPEDTLEAYRQLLPAFGAWVRKPG